MELMTNIHVTIWKPKAEYRTRAAMTFHRDELTAIAGNRKGSTSLVFFLVVLHPDNHNANDENAVAVLTSGPPPKLLGYLPREVAAEYRKRMTSYGFEHCTSACEAVLSGGLVAPDKTYDFILELDLAMDEAPSPEHLVIHPELQRIPAYPEFVRDADGAWRFKVWIPHGAPEDLHRERRAHGWTTESWSTVNYYLMNASGIGLGHKVLSVPKGKHTKALGAEPVKVRVEDITRRWATIVLER
jgi:hypothetical protein